MRPFKRYLRIICLLVVFASESLLLAQSVPVPDLPPIYDRPDILSSVYFPIGISDRIPSVGRFDGAMHLYGGTPAGLTYQVVSKVNLIAEKSFFDIFELAVKSTFIGERGRGRFVVFKRGAPPEGSRGWQPDNLPSFLGETISGHTYPLTSTLLVTDSIQFHNVLEPLRQSRATAGDMILFIDSTKRTGTKERYTWLLTLKERQEAFQIGFQDTYNSQTLGANQTRTPDGQTVIYPKNKKRALLGVGRVNTIRNTLNYKGFTYRFEMDYESVAGRKVPAPIGPNVPVGHIRPLELRVSQLRGEASNVGLQVFKANREVMADKLNSGDAIDLSFLEDDNERVFRNRDEYLLQVIVQINDRKFGIFGAYQGQQDIEKDFPHGSSLPY